MTCCQADWAGLWPGLRASDDDLVSYWLEPLPLTKLFLSDRLREAFPRPQLRPAPPRALIPHTRVATGRRVLAPLRGEPSFPSGNVRPRFPHQSELPEVGARSQSRPAPSRLAGTPAGARKGPPRRRRAPSQRRDSTDTGRASENETQLRARRVHVERRMTSRPRRRGGTRPRAPLLLCLPRGCWDCTLMPSPSTLPGCDGSHPRALGVGERTGSRGEPPGSCVPGPSQTAGSWSRLRLPAPQLPICETLRGGAVWWGPSQRRRLIPYCRY